MTAEVDPRRRSRRGAGTVLTGTVVRGAGHGTRLGFPSANIRPDADSPFPPDGVWVARIEVPGWAGSIALGRLAALCVTSAPLYTGARVCVHAYLLDFDGDLDARWVKARVLDYLRAPVTLASEAAAVRRLGADLDDVRRWRW